MRCALKGFKHIQTRGDYHERHGPLVNKCFHCPIGDLEKEKRRLQNILEMGKDAPTVPVPQSPNSDVPEEMDPFQKSETFSITII